MRIDVHIIFVRNNIYDAQRCILEHYRRRINKLNLIKIRPILGYLSHKFK